MSLPSEPSPEFSVGRELPLTSSDGCCASLLGVEEVSVREDDLARFAADDGLLARIEERPSGMSDEEHMYLLDRAREHLARAGDLTLDEAGRLLHECSTENQLTIQASDQFAIVSAWGRLLIVLARVELHGVCHPEQN
jgi:hypothetical protein